MRAIRAKAIVGGRARVGFCAALGLAFRLALAAAAPASAEPAGFDLFAGADGEPVARSLGSRAPAGILEPPASWREEFGSGTPASAEGDDGDSAAAPAAIPPHHALLSGRTLYLTLGVFASIPVIGELVWWKGNERGKFHFTDEEWFQHDSYAGGADKASHFFFGYMVTRELSKWYGRFGNAPAQSRALAAAVSVLGGALVELGDGFTDIYGYSWQDVAANATGALAAYGIEAAGISDVVGFRFGFVNAEIPPPCCRAYGYGHDYSEDVYSADLKLEGVLRRAGVRPGPARFFLVSMTYGSKGYRFSPVDVRERNIGVDLGLNMPEILLAVGVPKNKWWGEALLTIFEYIRFPYTAFGWQYDLNHHKWHGPSTGDRFDPGEVIYP